MLRSKSCIAWSGSARERQQGEHHRERRCWSDSASEMVLHDFPLIVIFQSRRMTPGILAEDTPLNESFVGSAPRIMAGRAFVWRSVAANGTLG